MGLKSVIEPNRSGNERKQLTMDCREPSLVKRAWHSTAWTQRGGEIKSEKMSPRIPSSPFFQSCKILLAVKQPDTCVEIGVLSGQQTCFLTSWSFALSLPLWSKYCHCLVLTNQEELAKEEVCQGGSWRVLGTCIESHPAKEHSLHLARLWVEFTKKTPILKCTSPSKIFSLDIQKGRKVPDRSYGPLFLSSM